ncbi:hypothetical protein BJX76DRAFT_355030 [Aspergillus varians]
MSPRQCSRRIAILLSTQFNLGLKRSFPANLIFSVTDTYDEIIPFSNQNFFQQTSNLSDQTIHYPYDDTINPSLILQDTLVPQSSNQDVGDWELPGGRNFPQFSWDERLSNDFDGDSWMEAQNITTSDALAAMPCYDSNQPLQPGMIPETMAEQFCGLQQPPALEDLGPSIEVPHDVETLLRPQVSLESLNCVGMASSWREKVHESSLCPLESSIDATTSDYAAPQRDISSTFMFEEPGGLSMLGATTDVFLAAETGVSEFERSAISTLTRESLDQQFQSIFFQWKKANFTLIDTGMPGPFAFPGIIAWPIACEVLVQFLERTDENDCSKTVLRHMSDVIRLRAKSNACCPPILFVVPPPQGPWQKWMILNSLFCVSPNLHKPSQEESAPTSGSIPFEGVFQTLAWVSRRYFEISLFSYLQKAANQLASVSGKELPKIAGNFLQVLSLGLSDTPGLKYMRLGQDSDEARRMEAVYTEQKRQVRLALSCYLRSALDKLDAWSDFWADQASSLTLITPKELRSALSDLDDFDAKAQDTLVTYDARIKEWAEWRSDFSPREDSNENCDSPKFSIAEYNDHLKMFTQNPPWKIDCQEILESLEVHYEPKLKLLREFYSDSPVLADAVDELINDLKTQQRTLTRKREVLEDVTASREEGKNLNETKVVIREAIELMNALDQLFKEISRRLLEANNNENIQAPEPST